MIVTVEPLYDIEQMWIACRDRARATVGKKAIESVVSEKFKREMLVSEHSPIRRLEFKITFEGIPTWVAQQFSRHAIASDNGGFYLFEDVNPTDVEHSVRTQRTDRTNQKRGPQDTPVNYTCDVNAQGLIDMSKTRLCKASSVEAVQAWSKVVEGVANLEPILANMLVPTCIYRGFCPEWRADCKWNHTRAHDKAFEKYRFNCSSMLFK